MAEITIGNALQRRQGSKSSPMIYPSEGWITLLLHILIIAITANSVLRVDQSDRSVVLVPLAIGGLLLGYFMARTPALDAIAHLLAVLLGAVLTFSVSAIRADGVSETWQRYGLNIFDLAERLIRVQVQMDQRRLPDDDLIVVIALTLWLVGYSSAWMLYRRHWLAPALVVPATLVFISLRFEEAEPTNLLAAFALASLIMVARHHAYMRQVEWSRSRVPAPRGLSGRFTASGIAIAIVALLAGSALPYQAPNSWVDRLADQVDGSWQRVTDQWDDLRGNIDGEPTGGGNFSRFDDSFRIGEKFTPSNEPVASLSAGEPTYLVARHYDIYDGLSWSSGVDDSFRMEGDDEGVNATNITFEPNQAVSLSGDADQQRDRRASEVTIIRDKGGLIYTTDTFVGANLRTVVIVGWKQLDGLEIDIANVDLADVPVDLQSLVKNLRAAEFNDDPATGKPIIANERLASDIEVEKARLLIYPVETELDYDANGNVVLIVSGRVPNYDDIESVFSGQSTMPTQYRVTGSVSMADEEQLRAAGDDYPEWVTDRYLQLPPTLTDQTVQLAADVVNDANATNAFDKAWAIQQHLRNTYQYAENSEPPPEDGDAVDFFLFGKRVGRCEDYAGAMVVMLRTQGIPARMVGGYRTGDERTPEGDYLFLEKQAHTWVEVFFPGYGWIPFEPTVIKPPFDYDGAREQPEVPDESIPELNQPTPTPEPTFEPIAEATPVPPAIVADVDDDSTSLGDRLSGGLTLISLGLTVLIALVVAAFAIVWAWGLRGLKPGAALYAKAIRVGRLLGVEPHPTMTPREFATEFGQAVPRAHRAVSVVADLYSAEQYGGIEVSEEVEYGGQQAWRSLRSAMFGWRPWRRRGR